MNFKENMWNERHLTQKSTHCMNIFIGSSTTGLINLWQGKVSIVEGMNINWKRAQVFGVMIMICISIGVQVAQLTVLVKSQQFVTKINYWDFIKIKKT